LDFHQKAWTKGRRETFNTELAKRGWTESGAPLSPSGRRTLEALLKYFGLIHYAAPIIQVTDAGQYFLKKPQKAFQLQMLKLQITNPVISEDCTGIQVFPFRATLRLLLDTRLKNFLAFREIGYILFMRMKHDSDHETIVKEITRFRSSSPTIQKKELTKFQRSPEGLVTLVRAPSVKYYAAFCINTGLCSRARDGLKINSGKEGEVRRLLSRFKNAETYDFKTDLRLWIEYFGNPERLAPPLDVPIKFS